MDTSYWRQLDIFSPSKFNKRVHVIGVGSIGSHIAFILAKMGISKISVYDDDIIEVHNIPNQIYGISAGEGKTKKVEALAKFIKEIAGLEIEVHSEKVENENRFFSGIVFVCVDTMNARRYIYEQHLKNHSLVDLMVEIRMGSEFGKIYTLNPWEPGQCKEYEETLHGDAEASRERCTSRAISTTAACIASIACHQIVHYQRNKEIQNEYIFSLNPPILSTSRW